MGRGLRVRVRGTVPFIAAILGFAACHDGDDREVVDGVAPPPGAEVILRAPDGVPNFVGGDLGRVTGGDDLASAEEVMQPVLQQVAPLFSARADQLRLVAVKTDDIGYRHFRYQQEVNGLEVVGARLDLHVDHREVVYLANGSARAVTIDALPTTQLAEARAALFASDDYRGFTLESSRLVYLAASQGDRPYLTWEMVASGARGADPVRDKVYIDARGGSLVEVHPTIHMAKNRNTHNLNNSTILPGPLARSEGQGPVADIDVNFAHDFAGDTYDCYDTLFNRDSFDNAGATLIGSVHYSSNYVNAFWNWTQMVYGDGDGVNAGPLDRALDVVAHELTHAVTERESTLIYSNESGALNEANSDIFGAICESWKDGAISGDTWKVGEDVWTPGISGDALRYMDNPTQDGSSRDYYPERYTGPQDNGGVHWNSGIPNLAFYLLVNGGQHPRGRTPGVTVTGQGIEIASQVWYRAATIYFQYTTNMAAARAATYQAAIDLFPLDPSVRQQVDNAWLAVGVGLPPAPPATVALTAGVPLGGTSGPPERTYSLDVPDGATSVTFTISGPNGDADLYGKFGNLPSNNDYEGKSESATSNETITFPTNGRVGLYYARVTAFSAYSNLSVVGSYTSGTPTSIELANGVTRTELSGAAGSLTPFTFVVPSGASTITFATAGGPGNADLYIKKGSPPGTGAGEYDYRSINAGNGETIVVGTQAVGTWYVLVHGASAFNAMSLTASYVSPLVRVWKPLSGGVNGKVRGRFDVPPGYSKLTVKITGGTGDADLYVRFGAKPTLVLWDYRPYLDGNEETVVITPPLVGSYYLMVNGKTAYDGVTLRATAR